MAHISTICAHLSVINLLKGALGVDREAGYNKVACVPNCSYLERIWAGVGGRIFSLLFERNAVETVFVRLYFCTECWGANGVGARGISEYV